jgi:Sec-independent protein translocase protein TatA
MFGVGPTELAFFLVIVLLAVGPERLPTFMRTVGRGLRQVRNASREFKEAIGFDELMREGDPFRAPPVRPPQARPVPVKEEEEEAASAPRPTPPPPVPEAARIASAPPGSDEVPAEPEAVVEPDPSGEPKHP